MFSAHLGKRNRDIDGSFGRFTEVLNAGLADLLHDLDVLVDVDLRLLNNSVVALQSLLDEDGVLEDLVLGSELAERGDDGFQVIKRLGISLQVVIVFGYDNESAQGILVADACALVQGDNDLRVVFNPVAVREVVTAADVSQGIQDCNGFRMVRAVERAVFDKELLVEADEDVLKLIFRKKLNVELPEFHNVYVVELACLAVHTALARSRTSFTLSEANEASRLTLSIDSAKNETQVFFNVVLMTETASDHLSCSMYIEVKEVLSSIVVVVTCVSSDENDDSNTSRITLSLDEAVLVVVVVEEDFLTRALDVVAIFSTISLKTLFSSLWVDLNHDQQRWNTDDRLEHGYLVSRVLVPAADEDSRSLFDPVLRVEEGRVLEHDLDSLLVPLNNMGGLAMVTKLEPKLDIDFFGTAESSSLDEL
ncbi:hypothetical protein RRF57_011247 [Xylaria bambusicola]|uniref:Uncharacterized protein n=1 Tax=Xylaria bambusicola TaxID=326684 RepID=A0AAN7UMG7_9PEZI